MGVIKTGYPPRFDHNRASTDRFCLNRKGARDMKSAKTLTLATLLVLLIVAGSLAFPQENANFAAREQNFREYVQLLRADVKSERKNIITQMMQFDDSEAAAFWPIFRQYDAELTKIGDGRVNLII